MTARRQTNDLAPCPFCGATKMLQTDKMVLECTEHDRAAMAEDGSKIEPEEEEWFVVCGSCGTLGPMSASPEHARTAWNRRV